MHSNILTSPQTQMDILPATATVWETMSNTPSHCIYKHCLFSASTDGHPAGHRHGVGDAAVLGPPAQPRHRHRRPAGAVSVCFGNGLLCFIFLLVALHVCRHCGSALLLLLQSCAALPEQVSEQLP